MCRNISGSILPIAVMLLTTIVTLSAAGIDMSYYGNIRSSLESATEAASVAGGQEYFRNGADAGKAINETIRIYKMNISNDTMIGNYHQSTGMGQPSTLTYSKIFTVSDGLRNLYREQPITVTVMTDLNRGKITVTSEVKAKPYFAQIFTPNTLIKVTREAELPPYDVVFVVDLSGSMRFATVYSYVGTARRKPAGALGLGTPFTDVIITQANDFNLLIGSWIRANGFDTRIVSISDIIINTPGFDIPPDATYSNGTRIYVDDPERGPIVNPIGTNTFNRNVLTGLRISELAVANVTAQDRQLAQSYADNRSSNNATFTNYFNMAAPFIEPHASTVFGVMSFIDTVRMYGAAALQLGLVTFSNNSSLNDASQTESSSYFIRQSPRASNLRKNVRTTFPYLNLLNPSSFTTITDRLTIMSTGGLGTLANPIMTYSYPYNGTNINAGLNNARTTLSNSNRPNSEKIIILFTDGEPSHSWDALGQNVKSITDSGIKVYSIVLTLVIPPASINEFRRQVEEIGKGEPIIFISDPARLKDAFLQIADELGLKLVN